MGKICKRDDWWRHTLNPRIWQFSEERYLGQFAAQTIETWQVNSSTGNTSTTVKIMFPWQLTLFQFPPSWFQYASYIQFEKTLNETTNSSEDVYMLVWLCILSAISKYQMGTPNVARIALIMKEAWNPVYCHGNKTVKLILCSTVRRTLLQRIKHFWYNLAEISNFNQFDQNWVECMTSSFG